MLPGEVNNVIKTLRRINIEVVAVHSHMLNDDPHIIFLHYLGKGPALDLARDSGPHWDELGKKGSGVG